MTPKLISLFAGIGGFDLAFERAGFRTTCVVEIDKNCRKLLSRRFPRAAQHDDVTTFDPSRHECPAVVTFGSPCQDLSIAGERAGMVAGETRSGLFYEAARIIRYYAERGLEFAVWENVPGAFSSDAGRDFACVLRAMAQCGAVDVAWRVLDAQFFGLAQRRQRVFLVADFRGERAAEILSFAQGLRGDSAPSREARQGVAPSTASRPKGGGGLGAEADLDGGLIHEVACSLRAQAQAQASHRSDSETYIPEIRQWPAEIAPTLNASFGDKQGLEDQHALNGGGCSSLPEISHCLNAGAMGRIDYETETLLPMRRGGFFDGPVPTLSASGAGTARTGLREYENSGTLRANGPGHDPVGSRVREGMSVRRLTPTECEKLQGFDVGWTEGFADGVRYKMLGNSVAVPCVQSIADEAAKLLIV